MAGNNTVDELFEIKNFYGCHSQALIISSILREFGFPVVMIETASVQWGYDYHAGAIEYFAGHVMSEIYVDNKWILLDNNCTYVEEYDNNNPFISSISQQDDYFVFAKGVDIWVSSNNPFMTASDKDVHGMLSELQYGADKVIFTRSNSPKAVFPQDLADMYTEICGKMYQTAMTLREAAKIAKSAVSREDLICVTGSFYLVGQAKEQLQSE